MTGTELKPLTGLRGIAATLVMLDHYAAIDFSAPFPLNMLPHMYLAVDMFMILSGFILAMTYGEQLGTRPSGKAVRRFIRRRIARLYPLFALTTVICFGLCRIGWLTFLNPDTSVTALFANLLAVQTWAWPGSSLNGPGWSVSTEWFASLAFPLLAPLVLMRPLVVATGTAALAFAGVVAAAILSGQLFDVPSPGAVNVISGPGALGRCVGEFIMGMYCWRLRRVAPWVLGLARTPVQAVLLITLFGLMQYTALDTVSVVACALLVTGLSFNGTIWSRSLTWRPLLWLGRISYSIYLLHIVLLPVRDGLHAVFERSGVPASWVLAVLCCSSMVLLLAHMTWMFVEQLAQRAILRSAA